MSSNPHTLDRQTFETSREMDFFSEKELTTQTGHARPEWPLVILKELVDNGLDACEENDIVPEITIEADAGGISVTDNGPGLPEDTIRGAADFTVRCSSREMYIAPDRGAQGNALMTLLAMPRVLDEENGKCIIECHGVRHEITCDADPITERARVNDDKTPSDVTQGTRVRIQWSESFDSDGDCQWPFQSYGREFVDEELKDNFWEKALSFAMFNPHARIVIRWFDAEEVRFEATDPTWEKWKANKPTSAHWYKPEHLERLIAAYITLARDTGKDRTVADFLAEFDCLKSSVKRKKITEATGLTRVHLSELIVGDELDHKRISSLLEAMKANSKPVQPKRMGVIGEEHFRARCEQIGYEHDSFKYVKKFHVEDGIPCVIETFFAYRGEDTSDDRFFFSGVNWSAGVANPFKSVGADGLGSILRDQRASVREPVIFGIHLAKARVEYRDRGKTEIILDGSEKSDE